MTSNPRDEVSSTRILSRPEGPVAYNVAYVVAGDGPLVVLVPGMSDLRSTCRFHRPRLAGCGACDTHLLV
jgi:hypothetical protein